MEQVATFYLQGINYVRGLGLMFSGYALNEGEVNDGDVIEFKLNNNRIRRVIKRTVMVNIPSNNKDEIYGSVGLIINCESKLEEENLKKSELKEIECLIFENKI